MKIISIFLVLAISLTAFSQTKKAYPQELQLLYTNLQAEFLKDTLGVKQVEQLLITLDNKGTWPDIDYTSQQRGGWIVIKHLKNLKNLVKLYLTEDSKYYKNTELMTKINLALDYWLVNDFVNPNWWNMQIGIPEQLAPVLIVMEEYLTPAQLKASIKILDRAKMGMSGQNKVWLSGNVLQKALLLRNIDSVAIAARAIQGELNLSTGSAIQTDFSFHEHGSMLQQGNYGLSFLEDMIRWIAVLRNTPFAFDENKMSIIRNLALDGSQWFLWKNTYDIAGSGRQLFNGEQIRKKNITMSQFRNLERVDPDFAAAYQKAQVYNSLIGNKHFWNSDYHVERTQNYLFTLKMSSSRVFGFESLNFENKLGYHLGSGMTLLYQTDQEYLNIFPFWDWKKLPGTTIIQDDAPLLVEKAAVKDNFVGGVTDGHNGIAVLQYNRLGLQSNKAWFMLDNQIVCLGNGITAKTPFEVTTSVNQVFLNGKVLVNTAKGTNNAHGKQEFVNLNWILHDHVGYVFPAGGNISLLANTVTGSWNKVAQRYKDEPVQADIFNLYINHGKNPIDAQYQYILLPNATEQQLMKFQKRAAFDILNTKQQQIVSSKDKNLLGIVFYKAGKLTAFGGITVSEPCLLLVERQKKGLKIAVSDPTQQLKNICITFDGKYQAENVTFDSKQSHLTVNFPEGNAAGKTVIAVLTK